MVSCRLNLTENTKLNNSGFRLKTCKQSIHYWHQHGNTFLFSNYLNLRFLLYLLCPTNSIVGGITWCCDPSVRLSNCLSHASKSKRCTLGYDVCKILIRNPCWKSNPPVSVVTWSPKVTETTFNSFDSVMNISKTKRYTRIGSHSLPIVCRSRRYQLTIGKDRNCISNCRWPESYRFGTIGATQACYRPNLYFATECYSISHA